MPVVPLNYAAILVAAVVNFIIGFLWHGPVFGKTWIKLLKIPHEKVEAMKRKGMGAMAPQMAMAAVSSLVFAFVLAHSMIFAMSYLSITGVMAGIQGGFWNWLGFMVPVTLNSSLWEGRSWPLFWFSASYYLVSILVMATILATWTA